MWLPWAKATGLWGKIGGLYTIYIEMALQDVLQGDPILSSVDYGFVNLDPETERDGSFPLWLLKSACVL